MKDRLIYLVYSLTFLTIWYNSFVWVLKYFAGSRYFIVDDPVLWFVLFLAFYTLEFSNNTY